MVSQISEKAILGMPFLVAQCNGAMNFEQPVVNVRGRPLTCTDRQGRLLLSKVQIVRDVVVPTSMEMTVPCRVTTENHHPLRLRESCPSGPSLAVSLNWPRPKEGVTARCLNLTNQPYHLQAWSVLGSYSRMEDHQVADEPPSPRSGPP